MNKIRTGIVIGTLSALAGGLVVFAVVKAKPEVVGHEVKSAPPKTTESRAFDDILKDQEKIFKNFDSLFDRNFFHQGDPFAEMKRMREQMHRQFENWNKDTSSGFLSSPFDSWYGNRFGGTVADISQREDKDNIYYDISIDGLGDSKVNTEVKNGYVTIKGEMKKEKGDDKAKSLMQSSFQRTFPVPSGVDADHMEMISEKGKITLRFPKKK